MASNLTSLIRSTCPVLIQSCLKPAFFKPLAVRFLYAPTTLGIDGYCLQREQIQKQLVNISQKFREKMAEYTTEDSKNMVFTEDLKNMLHLAESDEDVKLVFKMMKRFNQQNKQLRFGNYVFGPVVMRMFHHLNKPIEAYQAFTDPELKGFFDQLMTYQILLDLLYENKMYQEMLKAFQVIQDQQIDGIKFARNVVVLVLAACYKINTKESLDFAFKLWSELQQVGHLPMRRATTFCAALALNHQQPASAMEILSVSRNTNYTTVRNLKVLALVRLGRLEDAVAVLKSIIHEDSASEGPLQTFNRDVLDEVKQAVSKLDGNSGIKLEVERIMQYFEKQGHILDISLDTQLCEQIQTPALMDKRYNKRQPPFVRQYQGGNRFENRRTIGGRPQRPGLADLQ